MKIFLSYSEEDAKVVEDVAAVLVSEGHDVFFDKTSVPSGEPFTKQIRAEVASSDHFLFFVSRHSTTTGSYAISELQMAVDVKVPVLPVRLDDTQVEDGPMNVRAIQWFTTDGNLAADLAARFAPTRTAAPADQWSRRKLLVTGLATGGLVIVGGFTLPLRASKPLVANKSSNVVHHLSICQSHLPIPENRRNPTEGDEIHESLRVQIYEALAQNESNAQKKINLFILALEHDPCAIRIYDQLVRFLGKMKRYDSIHATLQQGHDRLVRLHDAAVSEVDRSRYIKAARDIRIRQVSAAKRAEKDIIH